MESVITVINYIPEYQSSIRRILEKIGWAEQYISSAEQNMQNFSQEKEHYGVYFAVLRNDVVGFLNVRYYAWNQLCQIQGLAVDPEIQRRGVASALVSRAEWFAHSKKARGSYVDTPTLNTGGRKFYEAIDYQLGYIMPRYYEDELDEVTYQKFFNTIQTV